jgi:hypothetical protein
MNKQEKLEKIRAHKLPVTIASNYLGVELELISPLNQTEVEQVIIDLKLEEYINLGRDGSIDVNKAGQHCYEARVLFKEEEAPSILERVQDFLFIIDAEYNNSCGLHVHFDMRRRNKALCYKNLIKKMSLIKDLVPRHRQSNTFCAFAHDPYGKYRAINFNNNRPTIEVRCREMTVDMEDLYKWILFLLNIIEDEDVSPLYVKERKAQCLKEANGIEVEDCDDDLFSDEDDYEGN